METGQMNMIQLPIEATLLTTVTGSSQPQSTQTGEQDSSAFAAILGGMTSQAPAQPTVVAVAVPAEILSQTGVTVETVPLVVMEVKPETVVALVTISALQISDKVLTEATLAVQLSEKVPAKATPSVQLSDKVLAEAACSEQPEKDVELKQPEDLIPQEVVMSAAGTQIVLAPQMVGRMPESGQNVDVQVVTVTNDELPVERTAAPKASEMPLRRIMEAYSGSAANASVTPSPALTQEAQRHVETVAAQATAQTPATPQAQEAPEAWVAPEVPATLQYQAAPETPAILQTRTAQQAPAAPKSQVAQQAQVAPQAPATPQSQAAPETPAILQTQTAPQAAAAPKSQVAQQAPASATQTASALPEAPAPSVRSAPVAPVGSVGSVDSAIPVIQAAKATEPAVSSIPLQQIMEAYSRPYSALSDAPVAVATVTEQRSVEAVLAQAGPVSLQVVTPVEIPSDQYLDAAPTVHTDLSVGITVVVTDAKGQGEQKLTLTPLPVVATEFEQPQTVATMPEQSQTVATMPEQPQEETTASPVQRAIETGAIPTRTVVKMNNGRPVVQEEQFQQKTAATTDVKTEVSRGTVLSVAVKGVAGATTGEDFLSGDKSPSDQAMNGQVHQVSQQRMKTDTVAVAPAVTVATSGVAEQVVKQVSDHFARHEIKTGSEQIVLRLSPENLGELKVNLRMENQRLTVEIVTENRMVRDAILQNSDTLKESLAKQNIKMDSFSVSSSNSGNDSLAGRNARNQNEWQELARNRQANEWLQSVYNLPKDFIPEKLAYNQQIEYGMLNVHY